MKWRFVENDIPQSLPQDKRAIEAQFYGLNFLEKAYFCPPFDLFLISGSIDSGHIARSSADFDKF